jgi:hypothetical protein
MPRQPDTKIVVDLPDNGGFGSYREEILHAANLGHGKFEVFNVPALANGIHVHDVVRCRVAEEGLPRFEEVLETAGWGTLHVITQPSMAAPAVDALISALRAAGGLVERGLGVVAVGVPPGTDPESVLALLNPAAERGELVFELEI